MRIYSKKTLDEFGKTHADVANVLQGWYRVAKSAKWQNIQDVKQSCSASADAAGRFTVFNIKGNKYRLIVSIDGTGQLKRDRRICVFFVGMKCTFQHPSLIN